MDNSKFTKEEKEEEEEEWSNNETGWTKYFESCGNESGSAVSNIKEDDGGCKNVEDDDSLDSDASSGPAYFEQSRSRRNTEDSEVKGHAKCFSDDEVEEELEKREQEKNKFGKKDGKKEKEKAKRRNFIKL